MSKISVIVPIYNVEKYLSRCVESILAQTYKNFEIILVDDGSPDKCPVICDTYEANYTCIRALHKENGGLSDARNAGIQIACGEYITFIDSDDYVNPLYLESLMKGIQSGADISVCDLIDVYDDEGMVHLDRGKFTIDVLNADKALAEILYQEFHDVSACGILLPLSLAQKYPFPKGKLFEDLFTTYKFYLNTKKVAFIRAQLYYYFQRKGSIMGKRNNAFINDLLEASNQLVQACDGKGSYIEKAALNKQFSNYCRLILQTSNLEKERPEIYQQIKNTLKKERLSVLLDPSARTKNRLAALALMGGIGGLRAAFMLKKIS